MSKMLKLERAFLVVCTLFLGGTAVESRAQEKSEKEYLELNFEQFDQNMDGGWRLHAKSGRYDQAAKLIEAYLDGRGDVTPGNKQMLHFHAGQMWAMGDQAEKAIGHFKKSTKSSKNDFMHWNDYVEGTIAFLEKDIDKLRSARDRVSKAEVPVSFNKNLVVLDMLLKAPKTSYREIFEALIKKSAEKARASASKS